MGMSTFKRMHTAEERAADATRMRLKYPDRIPVIVEKAAHTDMPELDKKKFLVPEEVTVGQFVHIIGKRLHLRSGQALFVFVGNVLPPTGSETFISCIDSYVSSGCLGKVLTVMMCCIYHGQKDDFILLHLYIGS